MSDETHKLQEDPPEGSRDVIEKELDRAPRRDKPDRQADAGRTGMPKDAPRPVKDREGE